MPEIHFVFSEVFLQCDALLLLVPKFFHESPPEAWSVYTFPVFIQAGNECVTVVCVCVSSASFSPPPTGV